MVMNNIENLLPFTPNEEQVKALNAFELFIQQKDERIFVLTGLAGTGKTSITQAMVHQLDLNNQSYFLTAPTGRACRVISSKTNKSAQTIHQLLFKPVVDEESLKISFQPKGNEDSEGTIYFVDEASMLGDSVDRQDNFSTPDSLLNCFFDYVGHSKENKIVFIGDPNQLPPIGSDFSPALAPDYLEAKFGWNCTHIQLTKVMRQQNETIAQKVSWETIQSIQNNDQTIEIYGKHVDSYWKALGLMGKTFDYKNPFDSVFIAPFHKNVNQINQFVRKARFGQKAEFTPLFPTDFLMSGQTIYGKNYELLNGDSLFFIKELEPIHKMGPFQFVRAQVALLKGNQNATILNLLINLSYLKSIDGKLLVEEEKQLIHERFKMNKNFRTTKDVRDDEYLSALKPRYGYAITCHKAQGGEWNNVFLHPFYKREDVRWIYTAVTRAKKVVFTMEEKNRPIPFSSVEIKAPTFHSKKKKAYPFKP